MAEEPTQRKRRIVKNPETFRERAVKAAETSDKPKRATRARRASGKVVSPIFRPLGRLFRKIGSFRIVRIFRRPARFIGKILVPVYFRNSWKELKLVNWPSWRESRQLTFAVLIFAIIFGASIALVDYGLDKVFKHILLK